MFNPKMEAISRDELHALQSERLRWTVKHEYDNVPVYRARMDAKGIRPEDIRDVDDLKYLPFMEKTDLRDQFPYGLLAAPLHRAPAAPPAIPSFPAIRSTMWMSGPN